MKKFNVRIYRNGGWFRKWVEIIEIEAHGFHVYKDEIDFFNYKNGNMAGCDGTESIAYFKADKYSIVEIK